MQNEFPQPDYCRTLLYQSTLCMLWVAYITAIGYGVDEAVWINVVETPIPYHVGGRRGGKKHTPRKNSEIKWLRKHLCIHMLSDTNGWVDLNIFKSTWTCYGTHSHLNIYPELCL